MADEQKITGYPGTVTQLTPTDLFDVSKDIGGGNFESQKMPTSLLNSTFKKKRLFAIINNNALPNIPFNPYSGFVTGQQIVGWNSVVLDEFETPYPGTWNATSGVFTAPKNGFYSVSVLTFLKILNYPGPTQDFDLFNIWLKNGFFGINISVPNNGGSPPNAAHGFYTGNVQTINYDANFATLPTSIKCYEIFISTIMLNKYLTEGEKICVRAFNKLIVADAGGDEPFNYTFKNGDAIHLSVEAIIP